MQVGNSFYTDVQWLSDNLGTEGLVIVDCQWDPNAYIRAHIPGAISRPGHPYIKSEKEGSQPGRFLPDAQEFGELMRQMGIGSNTTVICYDEWDNHFATRLWWLLTYYGHSDVKLLNGGWQAWVKAGMPISTSSHGPVPTEGFEIDIQPSKLVGLDEILDNYKNPDWQIIDARSPSEFEGANPAGNSRGGHIPGAINLEWKELLDKSEDGVSYLLSADEMERKLQAKGIRRDKTLISHCQAGVRASFLAYCLELLGYPDVRLYDGSMGEWANAEHTPLQ